MIRTSGAEREVITTKQGQQLMILFKITLQLLPLMISQIPGQLCTPSKHAKYFGSSLDLPPDRFIYHLKEICNGRNEPSLPTPHEPSQMASMPGISHNCVFIRCYSIPWYCHFR